MHIMIILFIAADQQKLIKQTIMKQIIMLTERHLRKGIFGI